MSADSKYYSEDVKNIKKIKFSVFTNTEIKKYSAVKDDPFGINLDDSYDNYEPKKGGLVDLRLGTCDIYLRCTTCGLNSLECPGHFGHTELAEPVFHYGFLAHLKNILHCVCLKCSNLLIERSDTNLKTILAKSSQERFKENKDTAKNVSYCPTCGAPVPKIRKEVKESAGSIRIILEREVRASLIDEATGTIQELKKKIKEYLTPRQCYNIFRNISDTDCYILGFNPKESRPEDLIIHRFPIPPVIIRPTAKIDFLASSTMEDSLTLKIADIVRSNIRVRNQIEKEVAGKEITTYSQEIHTLLQYHVATYYDNESASLPRSEFKTGGKPTKSISERIKSKSGRVRANLMGKRVDFSARSVITSDPYISIDQVGVPLKVAMNLTIPEEVTPFNIKKLTSLVKNGSDLYPGANFVFRKNYIDGKSINQKIDLKYRKKDIKLSYGDVVERHIVNGDYVLFNRQPTLHKPSMMGHRIHVLKRDDTNTFRMNVSVTKPYNADFDGDEMNIHLGQSIQARNELARIANVKLQIIGAKNSEPIIGCVQDAVSGAYLMTTTGIKLNYDEAADILCNTTSNTKTALTKKEQYSGGKVFSHIIPNGINSSKKKGTDTFFQIKNGNLIKGILDKSQLSTKKNSIIHYVWDKYGPTMTQNFIDDSQKLILNYLMLVGLTVSFGDAIISSKVGKQLREIINTKVLSIKHQITRYENDNDDLSTDIIEDSLSGELGIINTDLGNIIMKALDDTNNLKRIIKSGAKGSSLNVGQIMGCIGQVAIEGSRIKKKVTGRTIPYFHRGDDTPKARGFVKSNLVDGLEGHEFFFHTMGGREGLIDTAIKTAQTGYISRKLIKGLEDLTVKYDGTVRTASGTVIQYVYGENGINQLTQTHLKLNLINYTNKEVENIFGFDKQQMIKVQKKFKKLDIKKINQSYIKKMILLRNELRKITFMYSLNYKIIEDVFMLPVNLHRITQDYSFGKTNLELSPQDVIDGIEDILNDYKYRLIVGIKKNETGLIKQDERDLKYLFNISLHEYLSPKKCIFEYGISKNKFKELCDEIKLSFMKSLVEPGEMVGIIAAQSLGEPTTQMTLNTKHFSGVASKGSANMGVDRINELLSYSKSIKTPQMKIYFNDDINTNKSVVNSISSYFKHLTIGELIDSAEILYDVHGNDELSEELVRDDVKNPFFINNQKTDIKLIPLVFRFKMSIERMMDKDTTMLDIKTKFITYWYNNFSNLKNVKKGIKDIITKVGRLGIFSNNDNIIHIRFNMSFFNYTILTNFLKIVLNDITLKGINNVNDIYTDYERRIIFNQESGESVVEKEYVVSTSGINFKELNKIKGINRVRTKCNDVYTTLKMYGIEAARIILFNELRNTYIVGGGGFINHNHLALLVDFMTHTGGITSIDRHGFSKLKDLDPMSKASFEKTVDHFLNAAIFNQQDNLNSISSRIMIGRVISGGTGCFDLLIDIDILENSEYTKYETGGRLTFVPLEKDPLLIDIMKYGITETDFFIPK